MEYIESLLIIILEVLCGKIFYEIFAEKRKENSMWKENLYLVVLVLSSFFIGVLVRNYFAVKLLLSLAAISVVMYCYMELTYIKSLILALLFDGLLFVVDYFCFLLSRGLFREIAGIHDMNSLSGVLLVLLGKSILFAIILIVKKSVGNHTKAKLKDDEWLRLIFFPVFTICTTTTMILVIGKPHMNNRDVLFFIIAFGLSGMNIFVFCLINDILKRDEEMHEAQLFRIQMKNQTEMYYSISENLEKERQKIHEFKNIIICIDSLVGGKKYEKLESYIGRVSSELEKGLDSISTNHVIVDAILNTKHHEMQEKNIIFVFRINDLANIKMADEDIVVILSNLLNNAIEACEICSKKKIIKLKFVLDREEIVISVRNTYENVLFMQGGSYQTTKRDADNHGIGIRNVVNVVKKYHGSYVIRPDEDEFFVSIIIPNKEVLQELL